MAKTMQITIHPEQATKALGPLFGLFFEDINHAADGGLYAEMVRNRSFESLPLDGKGRRPLAGWQPYGHPRPRVERATPLNEHNPSYLRLRRGAGIRNLGYGKRGMAFKAGEVYRFRCQAWGCPIRVQLRAAEGDALLSEIVLQPQEDAWGPVHGELPCAQDTWGYLDIQPSGEGDVRLDMVSLFPTNVFRGRENGLRQDIAQALCDMKPSFLRFPGGCLIHDGSLDRDARDGIYWWKNTVRPLDEREARRNNWGYTQSLGLGFYEYFCFCEDIGAKPLPVVSGGCDPHHRRFAEGDVLQGFIQDALDLIEFANGPAGSEWGGLRAALGHPAPFGLEMIAVGNEEVHQDFYDRLPLFVDAIRARYPDMQIIGSSGPFAAGSEYDRGWRSARETRVDMVDEHYYMAPEWFLANLHRYDGIDPAGPRVFLGEYASWGNTWGNALAEAAYMTHLQNAPGVALACYAPMLCHADLVNWKPDMLWFDNARIMKTPNYYIQSMFMRHQGDENVAFTLTGAENTRPLMRTPASGPITLQANDTALKLTNIRLSSGGEISTLPSASISGKEEITLGQHDGDFELTMTAERIAGSKGMYIRFAGKSRRNRCEWSLGGWENQDCLINRVVCGRGSVLTQTMFSLKTGHAYDLRLKVEGRRIRTWVDGVLMNDCEDILPCPERLQMTASREGDDVIIKAVNVWNAPAPAQIRLAGWEEQDVRGEVEMLGGLPLSAANSLGEEEQVRPEVSSFAGKGCFAQVFPPRSVTVLRLRRG